MNNFETKMNALRLQFKAEQRQITRDAYRTIGRLNTAIGQVSSSEAHEALRARKEQEYEAMRRSHKYNRQCYLQQLEMLNDEQTAHLQHNPSNAQLRRMMACLCKQAESKGMKSLSIAFGDNRRGKVSFN